TSQSLLKRRADVERLIDVAKTELSEALDNQVAAERELAAVSAQVALGEASAPDLHTVEGRRTAARDRAHALVARVDGLKSILTEQQSEITEALSKVKAAAPTYVFDLIGEFEPRYRRAAA